MPNYDRLTALDNSFLLLEKDTSYTHVASTQIYDAGPLRMEDGGIDFEAIKKAHAAVLHLIPRYRQVLQWVPFTNQPVWVDDEHFDLDFHLRHTSLPRPGGERQLKRLSARIMQQHLDRKRPLWETWVVEGLEGDRFAIVSKVHHCMIDGVSGVDLLERLLSPSPDVELDTPPAYLPRPRPTGLELVRAEVTRNLRLPLDVARGVSSFVTEARDVRREVTNRLRAASDTLGVSLTAPASTPINEPIGPHRRFEWSKVSLEEIKRLRKGLGGSLNDIVLTLVTGAFQRFFSQRGFDPGEAEFRVMTPVSVRSADEKGALGNRVSSWVFELPLGEKDPRRQLEQISAKTKELKEAKQAVTADVLSQVAEWTPATLLSLGARNLSRMLPFNTIVTNVPGPQIPMYLLGARMLEVYPHVPLVDNLGLGIALMSYDGQLHWGFNADRDLVPDLNTFREATEESLEALNALLESGA